MKDVFLIYDGCCFYEIVTLSYFMRYSGCDLVFCAPEKKLVRAMEGFTVHPDLSVEELDCRQIRSLIVPGGTACVINRPGIHALLRALRDQRALIAGICAGVDVLDDAGILRNIRSTHSADEDLVCADNVITARANAYVDFAIKTAEVLGLFSSREDMEETIAFWKDRKRMQ